MSKKTKKKESFMGNVKLFISTYFLALLIRTFIIEASQIPSQSMVPSLLVGDTLMVEKVSLGAYIPVLNKKLPSFSAPKVNDMVVFVSPEWTKPSVMDELITFLSLSIINKDNTFSNPKILVKRIVAGPGDVLTMTNTKLYYNGQALNHGLLAIQKQPVYSGGRRQGVLRYDLFSESNQFYQRVTQNMTEKPIPIKDSIKLFDDEGFIYSLRSLLVYGFPPIKIPQKDVTIDLQKSNFYERYLLSFLIERESGIPTDFFNGKIFQDNKKIMTWTPKEDYYFMMGDNRDFSEDGRYFGFVPRSRIYGRILFRYWPPNRINYTANLTAKNVKRNIRK